MYNLDKVTDDRMWERKEYGGLNACHCWYQRNKSMARKNGSLETWERKYRGVQGRGIVVMGQREGYIKGNKAVGVWLWGIGGGV